MRPVNPKETSLEVWRVPEGAHYLWQEWNDEFIVFNNLSSHSHLLDAFSAQVLKALEPHPRDIESLARGLGERFDLETENLESRVALIVERFDALGLVEPDRS